jgi:hypothetical protein
MKFTIQLLAFLILALPGCEQSTKQAASYPYASEAVTSAKSASLRMPEQLSGAMPSREASIAGTITVQDLSAGGKTVDSSLLPPSEGSQQPTSVNRKIIYNADIKLVVQNFTKIQTEITDLVKNFRGYIAEQELLGAPGAKRSGRWKIRIPVDQFEPFLAEVLTLGELERNSRTSQDITEQFTDFDARLKNKTVEEQRLQKILTENPGKIEDILKIETELSRVRGEIEQLQGRLRMLDNLSSLTTISLLVNERENFQPPPPFAPDFEFRRNRAFWDSWKKIQESAEAQVVSGVGLLPWIPIFLIAWLLAWLLLRWILRWILSIWPTVKAELFRSRSVLPTRSNQDSQPHQDYEAPDS